MAFNDIYKLRIHQRLHGQEVINVLHFKEDAPITGVGAQALADHFRTYMSPHLLGRACPDLYFEYVEVVPIVPIGEEPRLSLWPADTRGTLASQCQTGTLAEVVTLYTGQAGRRKRGRLYLAGGATINLVAGSWAANQSALTRTFATELAETYCVVPYATSWVLGVWSRVIAGPDPPYTTDAFTPVQVLTVRTTVRNQRRRQLGVGR